MSNKIQDKIDYLRVCPNGFSNEIADILEKMHTTLTEMSDHSGFTEGAGVYLSDLASSTLRELE